MPDRFGINQVAQVGLESAMGTPVAAGKLLSASQIELNIKHAGRGMRPTGGKFKTTVVPGKEWSEGSWKMPIVTYDEIVYMLCASHKKVVATADGATAKLWTIAPAQTDLDTLASYTVEIGASVRAHKAAYVVMPSFKATFTRDGVEAEGSLLGQALSDAITMTAGPTAIANVPVAGSQINFYLADSMAGLAGATALDRAFRVEYNLPERLKPFWPVKSAYTSFAAHGETAPDATVKVVMEADAAGMALLTNMRAGSTKWLRAAATGADITTGKPYLLQLDLAFKLEKDPDAFKDEDGGVYAIGWNAEVVYDPTAGYALQWLVRNTLAVL